MIDKLQAVFESIWWGIVLVLVVVMNMAFLIVGGNVLNALGLACAAFALAIWGAAWVMRH